MSLVHCRALTKALGKRSAVALSSVRQFAEEAKSDGGAPYRPWPFDRYFHPRAGEYWSAQYPPRSAQQDEYDAEELYLDEVEARLRKFDSKYRSSADYRELYNSFGWEQADDRALYNYGSGLGADELQYGRGKKIDVSNYLNADFQPVHRNPVPPVQFLSGAQVRRSRGSLSSFRELPPEAPSIWKYWNAYSVLGVATALLISKEWLMLGGHDTMEAVMLWAFWGMAGSVLADWLAWWHALTYQESYDMEYMTLSKKLKQVQKGVDAMKQKPDAAKLLTQLNDYRTALSKRILKRTVANRISRTNETVIAKLKAKITEEATVRVNTEKAWQKSALEQTLGSLSEESTKEEFMRKALAQFTAAESAKLSNTNVSVDSTLFTDTYQRNYAATKDAYISEQTSKGTLAWVFRSEAERVGGRKSAEQRTDDYKRRVAEWSKGRGTVDAPTPAFA